MSERPRPVRAAIVAFGLAALLPLALVPWREATVAAASDPGSMTQAAGVACDSGFGDTDTKVGMALQGVTLTRRGALAVGFTRSGQDDDFGQRRPAALRNTDGGWTRIWTASPGAEDGLVAVAAADRDTAWAVGFTTIEGRTMPLAMRWNGREWRVVRPKPAGLLTSLFTDVTMVGDNPFAVGYRMTASGGSEPIAARRDGTRWRYVSPRSGKRESMSLTGVAPDGRGGLWVVGHGGPGTEIRPVIYRRDDARWTRMKPPWIKGEAVLTDVVASAGDDAWAVGYQRVDGRSMPLVLHWNGRAWSRVTAPGFASDDAVLTAVTASRSGGIWAVGAAWNADLDSHEAVAAWWDGQAWNEISGIAGGTELNDVAGPLDAEGWAVGRAGLQSSTARVCLPAQSGVFGGSEPGDPEPPEDGLARGERGAGAGQTASDDASDEAESSALLAGRKGPRARNERKDRKDRASSSRRRQHQRTGLPVAKPIEGLVARDVARRAGIAEQTATYGAVVADFDGDGSDDLYIGRHGRPALLMLNEGGVFAQHEPMDFPAVDRHGCAAADVDGSGLPDLYCVLGGKRGSGFKANELWLDPGGPHPAEAAVEHGLADATGRGRRSAFLEAPRAGGVDLVVTNSPTRVDGLPSIGRLFRTRGDGAFSSRARTGFAARLGSLSVDDADFDGDGREDLLLVTGGQQAPLRGGTHLYRNTRRGLIDVTRQMRIRRIGEVDAELLDLDGDERLDLVQLSPTRLRISQLRKGRFRKVYERRLTHGRSISAGDVNADGRDDLYIVRSNGERNVPDVLLVNRGTGVAWSSLRIPQVRTGGGDDAVAIDHDGNGQEDFVVLNGQNARGPIQLIAFYRQ